jgi:HK97 family phage portal protein
MRIFPRFKNPFRRKQTQKIGVVSGGGQGKAIWTPVDYENFAKETYLKNVIAFAAIDEVAKSVASVPWKEFEKKGDSSDIVQDSPINDLLSRPNPQESFNALILSLISYLVMSGNGFLQRISPDTGPNKGEIRELHSLRPDRFKFLTDSQGKLKAYQHTLGTEVTTWPVDPLTMQSDILHLKTFHPLDDWWGAAPTESAAREIDTSNAATQWNKALLDNQARPGMVFSLIGAIGEDSFGQLERQLRDKTGAGHAGENLIITGENGTKAVPYGFSPADMDFSEGDLRLARKIARAYGVPPMLLGIPGEATFANYKEARLAFWETTIFWWLNYLKGELNNWIYTDEKNNRDRDRFVNYILDDVPALSIKRDAIWDRAQSADFISINEKREMVGKDSWGPSGDVILISANQIPLGFEIDEEKEEEDEKQIRQLLVELGYGESDINEMLGC